MIRFECKEYQSRDIPPLVYLGFFPPSEMVFILFILLVVPGNIHAQMRSYSGLQAVLMFLKSFRCVKKPERHSPFLIKNGIDLLNLKGKLVGRCLWSCSIHSYR